MLVANQLFYNKEIVEELGGIPETWEEFIDLMEEAVHVGYTPITSDEYEFVNFFEGVLYQTSGKEKLFDLMNSEASWTDDEFLKAFELMENLKRVDVSLMDGDPVEEFLA
ncbi:hypothetical protein AOA60_07445, partial [Pseudomonas sp. 2822-17]